MEDTETRLSNCLLKSGVGRRKRKAVWLQVEYGGNFLRVQNMAVPGAGDSISESCMQLTAYVSDRSLPARREDTDMKMIVEKTWFGSPYCRVLRGTICALPPG